jgi:hypothetical protein
VLAPARGVRNVPRVSEPLPFVTRLWFAWACFFLVLFDGELAARFFAARKGELPAPKSEAKPKPALPPPPSTDAALQLLALLQREGRLVDFLQQDVTTFSDEEIGAAARAVHMGARKALAAHVKLEPVRAEEEGAKVTLADGYDAESVKLSGNVAGKAPFTGVLRHRGWRAIDMSLPVAVKGHDVKVICPAEVEL